MYCKDKDRTRKEELSEFDFLGYTFKAVYIKCRDGKVRYNFIASVSKTSSKRFQDKIKSMEIHKSTGCKIDIIAEMLNPLIRGWMNYFGKFNLSAMRRTLQCIERKLIKWAMCKYKNFRGQTTQDRKMALHCETARAKDVCALEQPVFVLLNDKSRMKGDFHVRFREKFAVKLLLFTRLRGRRLVTASYSIAIIYY